MISHGTHRRTLAPLLATTFAVATQVPDAAAFERRGIVCELDELTREIALRTDPDAGYVCDVLYEKPDEGGTREVLWSARNDIDYCEPRFQTFVEALASRGWTCDYAESSADDDRDRPAMGAARAGAGDDETDGGAEESFRDRCVADAASRDDVETGGSVKGYCGCVADAMASHGLSEGDAEVMFGGLASASGETGDGSNGGDKRLNTLAANYETVVESCR